MRTARKSQHIGARGEPGCAACASNRIERDLLKILRKSAPPNAAGLSDRRDTPSTRDVGAAHDSA